MKILRSSEICRTRFSRVAASVALLFLGGCGHSPRNSVAAQSPASSGKPAAYLFDQSLAWTDLTAQCDFGPRDPRLPAHEKCEQYILSHLNPACDQVTRQNFPFRDDKRNVTLHLSNIIGVINPTGKPRIMISAHWDTRPTADNDFTIENRDKPIPGADDGASGAAVLLELARVLRQERPNCCVEMAFWDGEDWGPGEDKMYLGSVYFAEHPGPLKPDLSILLDMIGQKDLSIPEEAWSQSNFPRTVKAVWNAAAQVGQGAYFPQTVGQQIDDDQIPLAKMQVPSIDLIDFDYAYWHTLQDTPDKCDPNSLGAVGKTLEQYIRDISAASQS